MLATTLTCSLKLNLMLKPDSLQGTAFTAHWSKESVDKISMDEVEPFRYLAAALTTTIR